MKNIYIKWLLLLGYSPWKYGITSWSWDGEMPPSYGYFPHILFKKGVSVKIINFKKLVQSSQENAEKLALELFRDFLEK